MTRSQVEAIVAAASIPWANITGKPDIPAPVTPRTDSEIQSIADDRLNEQVKPFALEDQTAYPSAADIAPNPQTGQVPKAQSDGSVAWANDEQGSGGGGGLTQAQVDARISDQVKPKALKDAAKFETPADYELPKGLEAVDRNLIGGGWEPRSGGLQVSVPNETPHNLNAARALSYADQQGPFSPIRENDYVVVAIADSLDPDPDLFKYRLSIGSFPAIPGDQVTLLLDRAALLGLNTANTIRYYQIQVASIGVGDYIRAEYDEPVEISKDNVEGLNEALAERRTAGLIEVHNGTMPVPTLVDFSGTPLFRSAGDHA